MKTLNYPLVQETLYHEVLPNGLSVYILPKKGFQKTYATFTTRFGSVDNTFALDGEQPVRVEDGIAHFLEHKMFEEPHGDIFATFASQGASANAFTSFDRTAYLFSATEQIPANLTTLLDFVQNPYFTDENVEKEKGIIEQEINMYKDNPDWRVYTGLIDALYHKHPVHIDIAGSVESIRRITKESLYQCYRTFYHPSNMLLFVVGGVNPDEIMELVRRNQEGKTFGESPNITRTVETEPEQVKLEVKRSELAVSLPKVLFGFKETVLPADSKELLEKEVSSKLMLEALLGPSSRLYQQLYDDDLISDSFGYEYNSSGSYGFSLIGGDTKDPEALLSAIRSSLEAALEEGLNAEDFERIRRKRIGSYLRMLNSPEAIANEFTRYKFRGSDLFDLLPLYESVSLEQVNERMRDHFNWDQMAVSIVDRPTS
ncbi:EF-P 5-aminopentanol modification-associated protein YfmH [Paenibacillus daejeonensis]|uniref:EF-P 5-aminopentanol modification-associated protein YfmH n=1 Tax=Paenibacillus daejeonensis TaxID=135193 RepID=UPI000370E082|nr:pitrilysin family protein [Paenibacillus daejeonensis]